MLPRIVNPAGTRPRFHGHVPAGLNENFEGNYLLTVVTSATRSLVAVVTVTTLVLRHWRECYHPGVMDDYADCVERRLVSGNCAHGTNTRSHYDVSKRHRNTVLEVRGGRTHVNRAGEALRPGDGDRANTIDGRYLAFQVRQFDVDVQCGGRGGAIHFDADLLTNRQVRRAKGQSITLEGCCSCAINLLSI